MVKSCDSYLQLNTIVNRLIFQKKMSKMLLKISIIYETPINSHSAMVDKFIDVMDKDFNTANGISVVYEFAKWINSGNYSEKIKEVFADMLDVFGIVFTDEPLDENIEQLIQKREVARKNKDFTTADQIRNELKELGILLEDTKTGVRWTKRG